MSTKIKLVSVFVWVLVIFAIYPLRLQAQLESSNWVFGRACGIDFNAEKPRYFSGSSINTSEGCSSISDANGNLLFYTDGISVWNRDNKLMPNGDKLNGNISSTQSVIIVPKPDSNTLYYIFTLDWEAEIKGFSYSVIDITKCAGLGDVVQKNELIKIHCTERIAAVRHENKRDIWIVIHEFNTDAFCAYLLTNQGITSDPVFSNVGIKHQKSRFNTIGYMKFSMDYKKLAVAVTGDAVVQLFDFDCSTGAVSNPKTIKFSKDINPYGLEFSSNDDFLYVSTAAKGSVFQVYARANTERELQRSLTLVGKGRENFGALQMGIDGKIYLAEYMSGFLSVIENPNLAGDECGFKLSAIALDSSKCMFGLPSFFQEYIKVIDIKRRSSVFNKKIRTELNRNYILKNVYFDFNKVEFKKSSVAELYYLTSLLKKNPSFKIDIIGHTDSIGTMTYNDKLSLDRAIFIANYLINKGIAKDRIKAIGKGSTEPFASNDTQSGRDDNRRVEFVLKEN